jgi:hypothetical protein
MNPSTTLLPIEDADRRTPIDAAMSRIFTRTADGRLGLVKRAGWRAVAAEGSLLSNEGWRRSTAAMLQRDGVDVLHTVVLDSGPDAPPLEVPATEAGIGELMHRLGGLNLVVAPPDERWAIVSTHEDIAAFLGPEEVVAELLGGDIAPARAGLEEFLDSDFWWEDMLTYFRSLIAAIESYDDLPDGEVAVLPVHV